MEATTVLRTTENIAVREEEGNQFTLYHDEQAFETNAVGAEIIVICRQPHTLSALCDTLADRFDVDPSLLREDVAAIIPDLIACDLLTRG